MLHSFNETGAVIGSQGQSTQRSDHTTESLSRSFGHEFGRSMCMSLGSDGSAVTDGDGAGSGWETGQASHGDDTTWYSTNWNTDAQHAYSSTQTGHAGQNSVDSFSFNNWWSETYGNGSASGSASGGCDASGQMSAWSEEDLEWWEWFADETGSASGSGGGSSTCGSASSSTTSGTSYTDYPYSPGFSGQRYYLGADYGGTFGGSPPAPGGTPATTTNAMPTMASGATSGSASASGSASGSATGSGSGSASGSGASTRPSASILSEINELLKKGKLDSTLLDILEKHNIQVVSAEFIVVYPESEPEGKTSAGLALTFNGKPTIAVRASDSIAEKAKTLVHELTHIKQTIDRKPYSLEWEKEAHLAQELFALNAGLPLAPRLSSNGLPDRNKIEQYVNEVYGNIGTTKPLQPPRLINPQPIFPIP